MLFSSLLVCDPYLSLSSLPSYVRHFSLFSLPTCPLPAIAGIFSLPAFLRLNVLLSAQLVHLTGPSHWMLLHHRLTGPPLSQSTSLPVHLSTPSCWSIILPPAVTPTLVHRRLGGTPSLRKENYCYVDKTQEKPRTLFIGLK